MLASTLLVTVRGPGPSEPIDLEVPSDIPVGKLTDLLVEIYGYQENGSQKVLRAASSLQVEGMRTYLPPNSTLIEANVRDGAVLVLQANPSPSIPTDRLAPQNSRYNRPARSYPQVLPVNDLVINTPPAVQAGQTGAGVWLQYSLPMIMGLGSLIFVFAYGQNPLFLIAGIAMAIGSIGGSIAMAVVQRSSQKKQRKQQQKLYQDHLKQYKTYLHSLAQQQYEVSERLYYRLPRSKLEELAAKKLCEVSDLLHLDYENLATLLEQRTYLWERRPSDDDFLTVRIGLGSAHSLAAFPWI